MAQEKGFYKECGLEVTILRGGPDHPALPALTSGEADFVTLFLANAIVERSRGVKLKNVAQIVQRSSLLIVTHEKDGIDSPEDLAGKKISVWPAFDVQPRALFKKLGINVTILPQGYTLNLFLRGGVDAASAMWYNEYHTLLNSGLEENDLKIFFYDEFDLNVPEDGLYCLESTLDDDPERCYQFVRATLQGWEYAFERQEETLDVVMRYVTEANLPSSQVHQRWMLARMKDIIKPDGRSYTLGELSETDYETACHVLAAVGSIQVCPDFMEFYERCIDSHN